MDVLDYDKALRMFTIYVPHAEDYSIKSISYSWNGTFIFKVAEENKTFHVDIETKKIVVTYPDTWRFPEHREVIYDADEEVKKILDDFHEWQENRVSEIHTWHPSIWAD